MKCRSFFLWQKLQIYILLILLDGFPPNTLNDMHDNEADYIVRISNVYGFVLWAQCTNVLYDMLHGCIMKMQKRQTEKTEKQKR